MYIRCLQVLKELNHQRDYIDLVPRLIHTSEGLDSTAL